jgi:hypothetical protein
MFQFVDSKHLPPDPPPATHGKGHLLQVLCCAVTVGLGAAPWTEVAVPSLWGQHNGPCGWRTTDGAISSIVALMVLALTLVERISPAGREAVRPGILLVSWIGVLAMGRSVIEGPGSIRSVTAAHTPAFWLAAAGTVAVAVVASRRLRMRRVPQQ